jgi:hypothetical protein
MPILDNLEILFVATAYLFQVVLIVHFGLRKWRFPVVGRYGWIVYALSIPAATVSVALLAGGKDCSLWLGGFLYLVWAIFGFTVEYVRKITGWRNPSQWSILVPYVFLYLATTMFYWWPLGLLYKPLWIMGAALFLISTTLNLTSHHAPTGGASSV